MGGYRRGCIAINGGEEKSRAFGIFAGGRVCLAGALLVLAALAGRCLASAWLAVLAVCFLPCAWVGGRVCLARWRWRWCCSSAGGSGLRRAGMLRRRSAIPADTHGPRRHDRPRLRRGPAHHAAALRLCHRRTPRRKRPRPAAEGIYRARSRLPVSYANMPPIIPQPVQSAQKIATDFCAKIIPRPPKGGPWEGISAY